ncbi:hypothetical protein ABFT23_12710 [Nocardioides sp. C4-1]|uniref:DUF7674 family protein n=1 Tax=Nocardioides sp. C4-1 TaxID=3151851 RepID=UPI003264208E
MITYAEVLDLVLPTLPDPPELDDAGELPYLDASTLAVHVVDLVRAGRSDVLGPFFAAVERLHLEGDGDVTTLATIGYLESLQNYAGHAGLDTSVFLPLLGPESARWWRGLDAFWAGEAPAVLPVD